MSSITPIFDYSDGSDPHSIATALIARLNATPAGTIVRFTTYQFTNQAIADAVNSAQARGVFFYMIFDWSGTNYPAVDSIVAQFAANPNGSYVLKTPNRSGTSGAVGNNILHSKFILFQDDKSIWVMSANCTLTNNWNNCVQLKGYPNLYSAFQSRFYAMKDAVIKNQAMKTAYGTVLDQNIKAYFYPRPDGTDTLLAFLNNMTPASTAELYIASYLFSDSGVASKLKSMRAKGTLIKVIYTDNTNFSTGQAPALSALGTSIPTKMFPFVGTGYVHSKYMLWRGKYLGVAQKMVWCGSLNWSNYSMKHNDEIQLKIDDNATYDAYKADFDILWAHA